MPAAPSSSASSALGEKALTIMSIILIFGLHRFLLGFAQYNEVEDELYLHTLLLLTLPRLIGSFQNLKQHQRWLAYYAIWFQLMIDTCSDNDMAFILFDLTIFMNMESIFQRHLKAITGGQPVPRTVYWSSWVSNTRLESYIAAHRSIENADSNNEDDSNEQAVSPTSTTTTTTITTAMRIKAKFGYLLASIVLLINVYQEFKISYIDYFCYHGPDANGFYLDPVSNYITGNPKYAAYCYPPSSSFVESFVYYLPIWARGFPAFLPLILNRLSGLLFALAWSTIPTDVIVTAWTQMWNSPSSRLRKFHYFVIMYPIKMAALVLILVYTPDEREDVAPTNYSPSQLSAVRAKYLLLWFIFFRAATKLAFGLGFIWHLYAVSLCAGVGRGYHEKEEASRVDEKEEKGEQLL